jgi:hypothetical protein
MDERLQQGLLAARGDGGRGQPGSKLEHVDGQPHQVGEGRRQPGAEVVHPNPHIAFHHAAENGDGRIRPLIERGFLHLKEEPRWIDRVGGQRLLD